MKIKIVPPVHIINFEKNEVVDLWAILYLIGLAIQFCICNVIPEIIWINKAPNNIISKILMGAKVAMKCAALLNSSGLLLSSFRLIIRCTGRNNRRNIPASAITNFLEIEEKMTLYIEYEMFMD